LEYTSVVEVVLFFAESDEHRASAKTSALFVDARDTTQVRTIQLAALDFGRDFGGTREEANRLEIPLVIAS
jgi:hypothetical protein